MNATPPKRAVPAPVAEFPPAQVALLDCPVAVETPRPSRLRGSGPHGLPVQIAYALIDCAMVGLAGALVFYLESGIARSPEARSQMLAPPTLGTYFAFISAYAVLVVLSCA